DGVHLAGAQGGEHVAEHVVATAVERHHHGAVEGLGQCHVGTAGDGRHAASDQVGRSAHPTAPPHEHRLVEDRVGAGEVHLPPALLRHALTVPHTVGPVFLDRRD